MCTKKEPNSIDSVGPAAAKAVAAAFNTAAALAGATDEHVAAVKMSSGRKVGPTVASAVKSVFC